jgi:hypothetical protein
MEIRDIFFFDKMLTPTIITFVYWIILVSCVIGGLFTMFSGDFFIGLGTIVGGVVLGRIWCELLIVLFKMNEALQVIKAK